MMLHALDFRVRVHAKAVYCSRLLRNKEKLFLHFFVVEIVAEIQNSRTEAKT